MRGRNQLPAAAFLLSLSACDAGPLHSATPLNVETQEVSHQSYFHAVTLTGAVRAKTQTDLSFRVSGRVIERKGDVGQHVEADDILARLDPTEQEADLKAAQAGLAAAEATVHQAAAAYDRQKALLATGFTTQAAFDLADRERRTALASREAAQAQLTAARDALSYTELRAVHAGVITARTIEVGQVAQAAQPVFGFAEDGLRDAVFAIYESILTNPPDPDVELKLVSDPNVAARGGIREISPVIEQKTGTVLVKVQIDPSSSSLPLGAPVAGRTHWRMDKVVILPWTALSQKLGEPAVWVVDPKSASVSLRPVTVALYEREQIVLSAGLTEGERVVTDGGKFLREGQTVREQDKERP